MDKIDNLQRDRKAKLNKLSKLKAIIVGLMGDEDFVNKVKCTFEKFKVVCEEATQMHVCLLRLLPKDKAAK